MLAIYVTDRENYLAREIQENSIKCTESEQKAARLACSRDFFPVSLSISPRRKTFVRRLDATACKGNGAL